MFKDEFEFNFKYDENVFDFMEQTCKYQEDFFKYNLNVYKDVCKELRTPNGQSAEEFRYKEIVHHSKERKEAEEKQPLIEWFRDTNNMENLGSICFEIIDKINFDLSCLNENTCDTFFRLEKLSLTKYQLHLFTKKNIGYMKASFFSIKTIDTRYEVTCVKYNKYTDHVIKKNGIETDISIANLDYNGFNRSLIYSAEKLFYCGIQFLIKSSFKLDKETFYLEISNLSQIELEYGLFARGKFIKAK